MNSNYSSSLIGGGNSLNIIRISSLIPLVDITTTSSLNGNINPRDTKCWNFTSYYVMLQNNTVDNFYMKIDGSTGYSYHNCSPNKSSIYGFSSNPLYGRFIIEYKE